MTGEARVVALDRLRPDDIPDSGRGLWLAATLADELSITLVHRGHGTCWEALPGTEGHPPL
jgi:anti-sigma regulatory factor (Ser/Thr protein kinase)